MCCFENILEATTHKTASVLPLTSHFINNPNKMNMTCKALLKKQGRTHKWCFSMKPYIYMHQCCLTSQEWWMIGIDSERERERESQGTLCNQCNMIYISNETAAVSPISQKNPRWSRCEALLEKQRSIHKWHFLMDPYIWTHTSVGLPARTYISSMQIQHAA